VRRECLERKTLARLAGTGSSRERGIVEQVCWNEPLWPGPSRKLRIKTSLPTLPDRQAGPPPPSFCKSGATKDLRQKSAVRVVQQRTYEILADFGDKLFDLKDLEEEVRGIGVGSRGC
jgi:hypothetical protein